MVSVVAFGDNVVDCYADRGVMLPGGNALNVSVFAHRFGAETSYVGAVGDDPAGRHIRDALIQEGVDVSRLRSLAGRTASCFIGGRNGEREFLRADLGVSIIAPNDGDLAHMESFDAVHTGRSSHVDPHLDAFAQRTRLSFDFAIVRDRERIARIAPRCFLVSFSGADLSRSGVQALCDDVRRAGARWCLVTRGHSGAMLAGPDGTAEVPAAETKAVDTLGAGDTFIARTLVGLLEAEPPDAALGAAAQASAETCSRVGAFGHPAPIDVDGSQARPLGEIYAAPVRPHADGEAG